jgi:hypothetical protein
LKQQGISLTKQALGGISTNAFDGVYGGNNIDNNPWTMKMGNGEFEDLSKWL